MLAAKMAAAITFLSNTFLAILAFLIIDIEIVAAGVSS